MKKGAGAPAIYPMVLQIEEVPLPRPPSSRSYSGSGDSRPMNSNGISREHNSSDSEPKDRSLFGEKMKSSSARVVQIEEVPLPRPSRPRSSSGDSRPMKSHGISREHNSAEPNKRSLAGEKKSSAMVLQIEEVPLPRPPSRFNSGDSKPLKSHGISREHNSAEAKDGFLAGERKSSAMVPKIEEVPRPPSRSSSGDSRPMKSHGITEHNSAEANKRYLAGEKKNVIITDSYDVNDLAEAYIKKYRQKLHLQRLETLKNPDQMLITGR